MIIILIHAMPHNLLSLIIMSEVSRTILYSRCSTILCFTDISDSSEDSGDEGVADGEEEEEVCDWAFITSLIIIGIVMIGGP